MPDRHSKKLRHLRGALETMPELPRAVFDRHRFEDMSYPQIAAELGIEVAAVERALADAMIHLTREGDASGPERSPRLWAWLRAAFTRFCRT